MLCQHWFVSFQICRSLGCTVVEMLTGKPPYITMPMPKFAVAIERKSLSYNPDELVPGASEAMKIFLSRLFQYDPKNRLSTGVEAVGNFRELF